MSALWRYLGRQPGLPAAWRGPAFALLVWRPWRAIGAGLAMVGALAVSGNGAEAVVSTVELYGVPALVLAMIGGTVGRDRGSARHFVLFQRAGSESGHYLRLWVLAYVCIVTLVGAVAALFVLGSGGDVRGLALLAGALTFATVLATTAMLAATLLRSGETVLVVAWTIAPILLAVVAQKSGLSPAASAALEAPFVPLNGVFALQRALATSSWNDWRPWWGVQLAIYPAVCVILACLRLKALERRGAE